MTTHLLIFAIALATASADAVPQGLPDDARCAAQLRQLVAQAHAQGTAVLLDVKTGRTIATVGVGRNVTAPVLPLSIIKLYVAAIWWEADLGDGDFVDPRHGRVSLREVVADGWDVPGAEAAIQLRRKLGGERVLAALRAHGLGAPPGTLTLAPMPTM
jgi:hypothetical protein